MKKYFSVLPLLFLTLWTSAQNQARFVPANSFVVTEFNLKTLYEKGNLEEIKKLQIFQEWEREMANEFDERYESAKVMWNNPAATGVDLNGFAYFYCSMSAETSERPQVGLVIPVKDAAKMEDFLLNKLDIDRKSKVQKVGKMKMVSLHGDAIIWGSDAVMIVDIPEDPNAVYPDYSEESTDKEIEKAWADYELQRAAWAKKQATVIAAYTPTGSILQEQHYRDLHAKNYDISLYVHNTKDVSEAIINAFLSGGYYYSMDHSMSSTALFDDHYTCSGVTFDKGNITLSSQSYYSPRLGQYIDPIYSTRFNPSLLRYINSKEAIGFTTASFSMPALKKVLKEKADSATRIAERHFAWGVYYKEIRRDAQVESYNTQISELETKIYAAYGYGVDSAGPANMNAEYVGDDNGDQAVAVTVDSTMVDENYEYTPVDYDYIESLRTQVDSLERLRDKRSEELGVALMKKDGFDPAWIWDIPGGDMLFSFDELSLETRTYEYPSYDPETYESVMTTRTDTIPYPHYTAVMSIGDKTKAEKLLTILSKQGYIKNKGSYYSVVVPGDNKHEHFLYLSNGNLVMTNNSKLAVLSRDGFQDGRGYDPILAARCQENMALFRFNTDILMSAMSKAKFSRKDRSSFSIIQNYVGAFEADGGKIQQGQHQGKATLEFGSLQENSLLQLFRFSNELYILYNR